MLPVRHDISANKELLIDRSKETNEIPMSTNG